MLALLTAIPMTMWAWVAVVAALFGISPLRLIIYTASVLAVVSSLLAVRHHYVKLGYDKALEQVQAQDRRAIQAAQAVQAQTKKCDDTNGFWDVVTQGCRLGDSLQ